MNPLVKWLLLIALGVLSLIGAAFVSLALLVREQPLEGVGGAAALRGALVGVASKSDQRGSCSARFYMLAEASAQRLVGDGRAALGAPSAAAGLTEADDWRQGPVDRLETVPWNPEHCKAEDAGDLADLLGRADTWFAIARGADEAAVLAISGAEARYVRVRFSYRRQDERHLGEAVGAAQ